ncbi:A/G-specific adenine glycosylase [Peribacillus asahii]|uniref:Adenine DNA glycosylase n=1 Tax=Peribacillus asahii TaxID=228899 RepID=A0A3T0KM61_9BACI|nr:A/G-specific adenine glycosylase [Peribacillus asahii]AZV41378.1 DNA glycosylase [Peribacillus asahii]USK85785.1 A/G-specific adenine glycosylase [Peribacillus asahii]
MNDKLEQSLLNIDKESFQNDLIDWFEAEQRNLPWRENKDPYRVWVSEIMLQQTRVDTVIPYFNRFIEWFPTLDDFAEADEEKILKAWEGLGYYSRVRNLHSAVKEVKETYNSVVPDSPEEISKLKGVGPYTAGAILSIAYGKPEPAVDGNVMRVLSRILIIAEDIAKPKTRKTFETAVRALISHENPSAFNQALMELGALICTPGKPACLLCPVQKHCQAFAAGIQTELPVKIQKKKTRDVPIVAAVLKNERDEFLIHKRSSEGLLANLWEFPNYEMHTSIQPKRAFFEASFLESYRTDVKLSDSFTTLDHVFSHLVWRIDAYRGSLLKDIEESVMKEQNLKWVSKEELEQYAFPVSHQKIWKSYQQTYVMD